MIEAVSEAATRIAEEEATVEEAEGTPIVEVGIRIEAATRLLV